MNRDKLKHLKALSKLDKEKRLDELNQKWGIAEPSRRTEQTAEEMEERHGSRKSSGISDARRPRGSFSFGAQGLVEVDAEITVHAGLAQKQAILDLNSMSIAAGWIVGMPSLEGERL